MLLYSHPILIISETISNIICFLSKANDLDGRRYCGLSNIEIANAMTRIAVNDDNKRTVSSRAYMALCTFVVHK